MAELAVTPALFLVDEVLSFLNHELNLKKDVHEEVEGIKIWLEKIEAYIKDNEDTEGSATLKTQIKQVRNVAYDIQDVLEEFMLHVPRELHRFKLYQKAYEVAHSVKHWSSFHEIFSKIKSINNKINKIVSSDLLVAGSTTHGLQESSSHSLGSRNCMTPHFLDNDEIIGFEKPIKELTDQLRDGASRVNTISVLGPGGSGKSILVKKVFESKRVMGQFDCHAWVYVSSSYSDETLQDILYSMLKQFSASREEPIPHKHGVDDTLSNLKYYLEQKRYLLVLDDVWRKEHWERVKNALPGNFCGSRIIITTRHSDVASSCVTSPHFIHHLTSLPWPEAWKLFCKKAFQNGDGRCPLELEDCSQKIVKRCEGSPLAIVAVGGLLSNKPKFLSAWEKFYDSLGSEIVANSDLAIINKTLLPSYKDLSSNLKNCFLYFSIFPADYSIRRERLIRLWAAERFVIQPRGKTLEEAAETYLNELIGRNLIRVSQWDFDGRVRRCRAVNLVLEFVIQKSEEENFAVVVAGPDGIPNERIRRLSIHNPNITLTRNRDFSCVRSMISFRWGNLSPSDIDDILGKFKLLRVLDLEGAPLEEFPKYVFLLTLLRYLSLRRTRIKSVPKSIKKLLYLETLDLKQTHVTKLPKEIWQLHNLRHLLVYRYDAKNYVEFNSDQVVNVSKGVSALTNLQKLSLVKADKKCVLIKELGALVQLKKLGLISINRKSGPDLCESIQKMHQLITLDLCSISKEECLDLEYLAYPPRHLQRLYLKGGLEKLPGWISSLENLLRIGLKWSRLHDNPLRVLQHLPNLMELEMVDSYTCDVLELEAGRFRKLKILHIEEFSQLHTILIQEGAMPELRKLSLCTCSNLKTLPWGINYLTRVEELLLYDMHPEFIARLDKNSEDRQMVSHIPVIHSFTSSVDRTWTLQNLS